MLSKGDDWRMVRSCAFFLVELVLIACNSAQSGSADSTRAGAAGATSVAGASGSSSAGAGAGAAAGAGGNTSGGSLGQGSGGVTAGAGGDAGEGGDGGGPVSAQPPLKTALQPLPVAGAYPRAILRANGTILASISAQQASGNLGGTFFESTDDGLSFHLIGHIDEPNASAGLCCSTLYELPRALGALPAGTLLWATSTGWMQTKEPMKLPIWSSADGGRSWSPLSAIVAGAVYSLHHGLWEPEFSMLDDGTLVCHFSDETDPAHSQKLAAVRTSDGLHWSAARETVALTDGGLRPGMAVVRRGPSGAFYMSYEICGIDACSAHFRSSADGWDWGDATDAGSRPTTVDGKYFQHAPTLMWSSTPSQFGRFFLVGQVTANADGSPAVENGNFIMANAENGNLSWFAIPAPAPVSPAPYDDSCPNYSSPLLALDDGAAALELSSRYDGAVCRTYFARGPLLGTGDAGAVQSGNTYRLVNVQSAQCLDVAGASQEPGARIEQWTCNDLSPQNWTFWQAADGSFSLKAQSSGQCLALSKGAQAPGALVQQQPCDGGAAQSWALHQVGLGYFALLHAGGTCLDNAGGSITPGTNIDAWTCNDLSPQIWHLEPR